MCRFRWTPLLTFWLAAATAAGAATEPTSLTIATYNVENYGPANRMTEAGYRENYPKPEQQKQALRRVIRTLNADVIALQEMGTQPYLDELRQDLRSEGIDYPHSALANASDPDRHVALLSKWPLAAVVTHADLQFRYFDSKERVKRGLLEATVTTAHGPVTLFVVHLKSRYTDRADDPQSAIRRGGEATAVRNAILKRFPDPRVARFVLLGDCNDSKASRPLAYLQRRGDTAIATLLPAADGRGETWTHCWRREDTYSRVDHILVSAGLRPAVRNGAAIIYDGPHVRDASDHRPVVATFDFSVR